MKTHQDNFHPMRGHVEAGAQIVCENGDTLTVCATARGWQLVNQVGANVGEPSHNAYAIAELVVRHGR